MKKISLYILAGLGLLLGVILGISHADIESNSKPTEIKQQCPKTLMTESCLLCHSTPSFQVKEIRRTDSYDYPNHRTEIRINENREEYGYFYMTTIESTDLEKAFQYFWDHQFTEVVIEIQSPGGGLFEAWRIVGIIEHWQSKGMSVETRVYGFAASAGFMIFNAGRPRRVSPTAELMWHEVSQLKFVLSTPSDDEESARIMRHLQDTVNIWLAEKSTMTKEGIDELVKKKEFWLTGRKALELGFADSLLN